MGNYTYDATEPAANSNPTNSQPTMLVNAASIASIIAQDHVGFSTDDGGYHKQISFNGNNIPGGAPSTVESFVYTDAGTANAAANLFIKNEVGTFPLSLLKASGVFTTTGAGVVLDMSYNCDSIAYAAVGQYTITLTTNSTTDNTAIILVSSSGTVNPSYSFTQDELVISLNVASKQVSFAVLQV